MFLMRLQLTDQFVHMKGQIFEVPNKPQLPGEGHPGFQAMTSILSGNVAINDSCDAGWKCHRLSTLGSLPWLLGISVSLQTPDQSSTTFLWWESLAAVII